MISNLSQFRFIWVILSGVLLFLGQRVWSDEIPGQIVTVIGVLLLGGIFLTGLLGRTKPSLAEPFASTARVLNPLALFSISVALYFVSTLFPVKPTGAIHWAGVFGWGWLLSLIIGVPLYIILEMALWNRSLDQEADQGRMVRANRIGFYLGLFLAIAVSFNFNINFHGIEWDLAYFKTTTPSQLTMDTAAGLEEKVEVALIFEENSAVHLEVKGYFDNLKSLSPKFEVVQFDADIYPTRATDFKANNGTIVLKKGGTLKNIRLGTHLERARNKLRKLDSEFLSALSEVSQPKRTAYFTVGHAEPNENPRDLRDKMRGQSTLNEVLSERNIQAKPLGFAEGLGHQIPADATLVVILGPRRPFLPGEVGVLADYLKKGGKLLVFMEPTYRERPPKDDHKQERPATLTGLLEKYGLKFQPVLQVNDKIFARRTFTREDHALLVTVGYQSHTSVRAIRGNSRAHALLMMESGSWLKVPSQPGLRATETIKGMAGTWGDLNGNLNFDPPVEKQDLPILAAAVEDPQKARTQPKKDLKDKAKQEIPSPRILAFGDADMALNLLMQNPANKNTVSEAIRWVAGDERGPGMTQSEEDLKILHAKGDEIFWFYLPVFGVPLIVLVIGYMLTVRRGIRRRAQQ